MGTRNSLISASKTTCLSISSLLIYGVNQGISMNGEMQAQDLPHRNLLSAVMFFSQEKKL
jgi:hypothetical protein